MNEQQKIYDELKNIVINLNKVIPALQNLSSTTADSFNETLSESVRHIDLRLKNLMQATVKLEDTTKENVLFIQSAERQAVNHVKNGVEKLITTNVSFEYQRQITEVLNELKPLIYQAINDEIERLGTIQRISIQSQNEKITELNEAVESDISKVIKKLSDSIDLISKLADKIKTNADAELSKLNEVSTAHIATLQSINNGTSNTAQSMIKTLRTIDRHAMFVAQSPITLSAILSAILSTGVALAIIYRYDLWLPFFVSCLAILAVMFGFWCVMYYIDKAQKKENN